MFVDLRATCQTAAYFTVVCLGYTRVKQYKKYTENICLRELNVGQKLIHDYSEESDFFVKCARPQAWPWYDLPIASGRICLVNFKITEYNIYIVNLKYWTIYTEQRNLKCYDITFNFVSEQHLYPFICYRHMYAPCNFNL